MSADIPVYVDKKECDNLLNYRRRIGWFQGAFITLFIVTFIYIFFIAKK